jgi:succinoglycan biosynthesis transport protein ExoP
MTASDSEGSFVTAPAVAAPSVGALAVRGEHTLMPFPEYQAPIGPPIEQASSGLDPRRLLHAIRRRWLPALLIGGALAPLVALPTWFLLPKGYEAVVWLQMRSESGMLGTNVVGYDQYRKTQMQLLKSPFVLNAALRRPGVSELATIKEQKAPTEWLAKNLIMSAPTESEVVTLRLRGPVAEDTAKILNAVTACYLDDIVNKDRAERLGKRDTLEKKYKENQSELRNRKETYNEMARTLGSLTNSEVVTQRGLLMDHLSTLRVEIAGLENDISRIDTELAISGDLDDQEDGEREVVDDAVDLAIDRDPAVSELKDRMRALGEAVSEQTARSARGANEPSVKRLREQYDSAARQLAALRRELRPQLARQLGGGSGQINAAVSPAVLRVRRTALAKNLDDAKADHEKVVNELLQIGKANADLELRRGEIEQLQRVTEQLGMQLEASAVDLTMPSRVRLLEEAAVPQTSSDLTRAVLAGLAGVLAFASGVGLTVGTELLRDRLSYPEEVPQRVGLRLLGTLPRLRRRGGKRVASELGRFMEAIDTIRTLTLQAGRDSAKVILVTSAGEHEGKTTLAAQLAASIARSGKRTLLIDGDLRHPSVHAILQIEQGTGFAEVLRGEVGTDEVIQPTEIDGLFAVTAGGHDAEAVLALSRPQLKSILQKYRDAFDNVVIDSGPAYELADSLLIGQQSDLVVLSAMRDATNVPHLIATVDRLRSVGIRVLGCVVHGVALGKARREYALARK